MLLPLRIVRAAVGGSLFALAVLAFILAISLAFQPARGQPVTHPPTNIHHTAYVWCGTCTVVADTLPVLVGTESGRIKSVTYLQGGAASTFVATVNINGSGVGGCSPVTVSSSTPTTAACTTGNSFASGQEVTIVISAPTGVPVSALVQVDWQAP